MADISELEPTQLKHRLDRGDKLTILDVREPEEITIAEFPGAMHIPMGDIPSRLTELDPAADWVVVCHHGMRSANVAMYLARMGFERVANLTGGIEQWSLTVDPSVPRY
jgi:rhodanese-related sulfurtransferase